MSEKWTKGPWFIVYMPVGDDDVGITGYEPSGEFVYGSPDSNKYVDFEKLANAHLIAAAPDLCEALEDLKQQVGKLEPRQGEDTGRLVASMCGATVALKKARGEQ